MDGESGGGIHLANAYVSLSTNTKGLRKEVDQALGGATAGGDKHGKTLGSRVSSGFKTAAKVGFAGAGLAAGTALAKGFGRLKGLDAAEGKLKGLGHSTKTVDGIMNDALKSVKGTAFGMEDAATGAAGMVAAGIKPGKELQSVLTLVGDSATIAGTGFGDMSSIFGKVAATGKLQGDELLQLSEAGIPALQFLSEELGVSTEKVSEMVSAGKVDFDTFAAAMEGGLGGAAQESGKTFSGAFANMGAAAGRLGASLLSGVFPQLKGGFGDVTALLDRMGPAAEVMGSKLGAGISAGASAMGDFVADFRAGEGAAGAFRDVLSDLWGSLSGAASSGFRALLPHLQTFASSMAALWPQVKSLASAVGGFLMAAFRAAQPYLKAFALIVGAVLVGALKVLPPILSVVMSAIGGLLGFLKPLLPVVAAVGAALLTKFVVGMIAAGVQSAIAAAKAVLFNAQMAIFIARTYAAAAAQKIAAVATKAWALAQRLMNAAMRANPIGLLITGLLLLGAGLVLAYKKSETFRRIVNAAWAGIKAAALATVSWFRNTAWPWMKSVFTNIGNVAKWLWRNAIAPAFRGIAAVAKWLYNNVIKPYFALVRSAFRAVGAIARWLWRNAIAPAFRGVSAVASWLWGKLKSAFARMRGGFSSVGRIARWLWDQIKAHFKRIADNAKWLWGKVKWAFDKLKAGASSVKNAIVKARDGIKSAWSKLNGYLRDPIKKALKWMNTHFIGNLNKMLGKLPGVDFKINPLSVKGFASGGWTGRGGKYKPAGVVHADEFVVSKRARNRFERDNPGALDHINRTGRMPGYYMGGKVSGLNPRFKKLLDEFNVAAGGRYSVYSGHRSNAHQQILYNRYLAGNGPVAARPGSSQHNKGLAADLAPSNARDVHGGLARRMGLVFTVPSESWHIEPSWGRGAGAMSGLTSGGGGGWGLDWVQSKIKGLTDKVKSLIGDFDPSKYGLAGKVLPPMFDKVRSAVTRKAKEGLSMFGGDSGDGSNISISKFANMGAREAVRGVANQYGWGRGAQWDALDYIINRESSWNPNAANPTSSARGLFQKMTNIHGPVESTAAGQARWGLNYIRGRYGNPVAARMFWNRNNWYAKGTDSARRGWSVVGEDGPELVNFSGGQQVYNRDQTMRLAKIASSAPSQRQGQPGLSGPVVVNVIDRDGSFVERMRGEIAANDSHHNTRARMGVGRRG